MEIALPVERVDTLELRVSEADSDSFEGAYAELHRHAYRVAYRLLGTREDAADVAQEAVRPRRRPLAGGGDSAATNRARAEAGRESSTGNGSTCTVRGTHPSTTPTR
jgi:hypothetical protein